MPVCPRAWSTLITGSGRLVGDVLVGSKDLNGISFTGSYSVGMKIYEKAMPNLTRVQLEMGGKNPMIILNDADIDKAVQLAVAQWLWRDRSGLYGDQPRDC